MSSTRNLILYITTDGPISSYNIYSGHFVDAGKLDNEPEDPKFLDPLKSMFNLKQVKAIVFTVFDDNFSCFHIIYDFRLRCRDFCQKHGIFHYFSITKHSDAFTALAQTQTMVKEGEAVLVVVSFFDDGKPGYALLKREKKCYRILKGGRSDCPQFTQSWKDDIVGNVKPKKIIFVKTKQDDRANAIQVMKQLFPGIEFIESVIKHSLQLLGLKVLQLMGERSIEYDVAIPCTQLYEVRLGDKCLIKIGDGDGDIVPFEESVIVDVDPEKSIELYNTCLFFMPFVLFKEVKLSTFKSKKVKVTLKLDYCSFYDLQVEPVEDSNLDTELPGKNVEDKHDIAEPEKVRMVFDKQNFVVSAFLDGKENILKNKDGLTKTPIYISFHQAKPVVGKVAMEIYADKPKFVVFDLIKLCSVTSDDIFNPKWGFRLSKEDDTLMVIMQTADEERKSTVAFLLALILKNGRAQIKKEYGKRMEEIEIGFDGFVPNETLKKNFVEAGKLLKIGIVFV